MDLLLRTIKSSYIQTQRTSSYNDFDSSFSEFLEMSNECKVIMTEIYKFLNDLSPAITNKIFQKQENYYSLRDPKSLVSKQKLITTYGIDTISFRGRQIWQDPPQDIKNSDTLKPFQI